MNRLATRPLLACVLVAGGLTSSLCAQPLQYQPGSLLIYPLWMNQAGKGSLISVTNTNGDRRVLANNFRRGDVNVHYFYIEQRNWRVFDRVERLTPNDIFTVITADHNPEQGEGFLYVVAEDPETELAIEFDYLIGKEVVVDMVGNVCYATVAYSIQANRPTPYSITDVNGNGRAEFNNTEYVRFPDVLFVDSFMEQVPSGIIDELVLLTTLGQDFRVDLDWLIYNNREDVFSRTFSFVCWTKVRLDQISAVTMFPNLNGQNPGGEARTGWARVDGRVATNIYTGELVDDPPFIGAHISTINAPPAILFQGMRLLHQDGYQDGRSLPIRF